MNIKPWARKMTLGSDNYILSEGALANLALNAAIEAEARLFEKKTSESSAEKLLKILEYFDRSLSDNVSRAALSPTEVNGLGAAAAAYYDVQITDVGEVAERLREIARDQGSQIQEFDKDNLRRFVKFCLVLNDVLSRSEFASEMGSWDDHPDRF